MRKKWEICKIRRRGKIIFTALYIHYSIKHIKTQFERNNVGHISDAGRWSDIFK